jgi:hypothetical protein
MDAGEWSVSFAFLTFYLRFSSPQYPLHTSLDAPQMIRIILALPGIEPQFFGLSNLYLSL